MFMQNSYFVVVNRIACIIWVNCTWLSGVWEYCKYHSATTNYLSGLFP